MYRQVLLRWHQHRGWCCLEPLTRLGMTDIPESIWESWEELLRTRWQGEQLMPIFHVYYFWFIWGPLKPDTEIYHPVA